MYAVSSLQRTNQEINDAYERSADAVYRVCCVYLKFNSADIMDAFQQTFLKYMLCKKPFQNSEHEKAWFIVTASNVCKDILKSAWKRSVMLERGQTDYVGPFEIDETMECIMALPDKYKTAVYLHYYEGYSAAEIGRMTGKAESTVFGTLHKARKLLKDMLTEVQK